MFEPQSNAEALSGRATGSLFFIGFGSLWFLTGLSALHRLTPATVAAVALLLVALALPAVRLLRRTAKAKRLDPKREAEVSRLFHRVNMVQWIAVAVAILLLNIFKRPAYIVPAIAAIVGLHLYPLARLFHYRAHYVTGALLILWSIGISTLLSPDRIASVGALGAAAILLLSAAFTLYSAWRSARAMS